jgi:HSP20 family protein
VREPLVDVFDEDKEVLVVAELPGASEKDIAVTIKDSALTLEAKGQHRYAKDIDLPAKVKPEPVRKVYRNGLLEIRFAKI